MDLIAKFCMQIILLLSEMQNLAIKIVKSMIRQRKWDINWKLSYLTQKFMNFIEV